VLKGIVSGRECGSTGKTRIKCFDVTSNEKEYLVLSVVDIGKILFPSRQVFQVLFAITAVFIKFKFTKLYTDGPK